MLQTPSQQSWQILGCTMISREVVVEWVLNAGNQTQNKTITSHQREREIERVDVQIIPHHDKFPSMNNVPSRGLCQPIHWAESFQDLWRFDDMYTRQRPQPCSLFMDKSHTKYNQTNKTRRCTAQCKYNQSKRSTNKKKRGRERESPFNKYSGESHTERSFDCWRDHRHCFFFFFSFHNFFNQILVPFYSF